MKTCRRMTTLIVLLAVLLSLCTITAFANVDDTSLGVDLTVDEEKYLEDYIGSLGSYVTTDRNKTEDTSKFVNINSNTYYITKGKTPAQLQSFLNSRLSIEKTKDITKGLGLEADTGAAAETIGGFRDIINLVLGIIVTLITVGLAIFTAFDVCYIVFPIFREKCDAQKMQGDGAMVKKTNNGESKLRFVSDEAQFAVHNASLEQGSNPLVNYFKNRALTYIVVAIILFILLTGNISLITDIVLKLVSGIMNVLSSWG